MTDDDAAGATILLVEDDEATRTFLADNLTADGFELLVADCARDACACSRRSTPTSSSLDVGLPDGSGLDLLRAVREADGVASRIDPRVAVLVLSGRAGELDRVRGFDRGCDDYVAKPFSYPELRGRVGALLRRVDRRRAGGRLRVGDLAVDVPGRRVAVRETDVELSQKEFALLRTLAAEPTRVFTKQELLRSIWGLRSIGTTRTLDSHACRLRHKLGVHGDRYVVNVWGVGYRLVDGPAGLSCRWAWSSPRTSCSRSRRSSSFWWRAAVAPRWPRVRRTSCAGRSRPRRWRCTRRGAAPATRPARPRSPRSRASSIAPGGPSTTSSAPPPGASRACAPPPVDLPALLADQAAAWRPAALAGGRALVVAPAPRLVLHADGHLIARALANLLANAVEHGAGAITLAARRRGDRLRLEVRDEGATGAGRGDGRGRATSTAAPGGRRSRTVPTGARGRVAAWLVDVHGAGRRPARARPPRRRRCGRSARRPAARRPRRRRDGRDPRPLPLGPPGRTARSGGRRRLRPAPLPPAPPRRMPA